MLKNLKIGDDFQKMLEKMDPHKICELDNRVDDLTQENVKLNKYFELLKREMERVRSKTEFCNILTPNAGSADKLSREDIQEIIHDYFVNNMFAKKIQTLESQLLEVKAFPEMVNDLNKKVARMQKEGDNHNLMYELRGLQEYVKKENLIMNNRINQLEAMIAEEKKRRPSSAGKNLGESRLGSSISYKKLTPVNCISCYTTDRKSIIKRL